VASSDLLQVSRIYTQMYWQLSQMPSHHYSDITLILHCGQFMWDDNFFY